MPEPASCRGASGDRGGYPGDVIRDATGENLLQPVHEGRVHGSRAGSGPGEDPEGDR